MLRQPLHAVFCLQENFIVSKCFSDHGFFEAEFEMNNKLREFLE